MTCTIDSGITSSIFDRQIEKGYLTLSVSSKMVKRAIKAYEFFLKRMFEEGFTLIVDCRAHFHCPASALIVDGEEIPVRVKEKRELRNINQGRLRSREYVPSGVLAIEIYGGTRWGATRVLVETESQKWADVFEDVIPYLHGAAARKRVHRLELEEWHRKIKEDERRREEHEQMIKDRASVVESIIQEVKLYEKAKAIRRYCDIMEQQMGSDEYRDRVATARLIADWIDPTTDYEDEILSDRYDVEDFL